MVVQVYGHSHAWFVMLNLHKKQKFGQAAKVWLSSKSLDKTTKNFG